MKRRRKRSDGAWLGAILALGIIAAAFLWGGEQQPAARTDNMPLVVVDAGHGGVDGGAAGPNGTLEADVNFEVAQKVKGYLQQEGCRVVMTRERQEGIFVDGENISSSKSKDMARRKEIIRETGADLIISIHQNAFPDERAYGAQVFYQAGSGAEVWADAIQDALAEAVQDGNHRRPQQGDYFIRVGNVPALLVECGFLSHPQEGLRLLEADYQHTLSKAIVKGTLDWWQAEQSSLRP